MLGLARRAELRVGAAALGVTAVILGSSCAPAARQLPWDVRVTDATLRARIRAVVATVHEGSCTGRTVWTLAYRPTMPPSDAPTEFAPGDYAFEIVARDAGCAEIARGCVVATLPEASGSRVTVTLAASTGAAACATSHCTDGLCAVDAGASDAGRDGSAQDVGGPDVGSACAAGHGDCNFDPTDACETSLSTLTDCGACGAACSRHHATESCATGACVIATCEANFDDCNGNDADGCETSLETTRDCGTCGASCNLAHAVARCGASGCEIASCHAGWDDCDTLPANGCEASLSSATSCGACATTCSGATPLCSATGCVAACVAPAVMCGTRCVDTTSTLSDCGACDRPCLAVHAAPTCAAGVCGAAVCDAGWADCNGSAGDGCERSVSTASDCASCGAACASASADTSCASGTCRVETCAPGRLDCDGSGTNGCEAQASAATSCGACGTSCSGATPVCAPTTSGGFACAASCPAPLTACGGTCVETATDAQHCGTCPNACSFPGASAICRGGVCRLQRCDAGTADCNGAPADGCEVTLATDADHCGGCGNACPTGPNATAVCAASVCSIRCDALHGDCDGMVATGCERPLNTMTDCGRCRTACAPSAAVGDCSTGTCVVTACAAGTDNCDGVAANGCETLVASDRHNCGSCRHMCTGPMGTCCMGVCASACP